MSKRFNKCPLCNKEYVYYDIHMKICEKREECSQKTSKENKDGT